MKPVISVILPVLNEQAVINDTLSHLRSLPFSQRIEIIVADGDRGAGTLSVIRDSRVIRVTCPRGRGAQLAEGAKRASGDLLVFLHADTRLPESAFPDVLTILNENSWAASSFDMGIAAGGTAFRVIERVANFRSRWTGIPYGDQALCVKREWYERVGGFRPLPLMEDVDLVRRLKKEGGQIRFFSSKVRTSARRWEKEGIVRCTLRNWIILCLYYLGVKPEALKRYYGD